MESGQGCRYSRNKPKYFAQENHRTRHRIKTDLRHYIKGETTMSIKDTFFLDQDKALLVVIDVQEKLCAAMDEKVLSRLSKNINILLESAAELKIPVLVTEQYVKGLGSTLPALKEKT